MSNYSRGRRLEYDVIHHLQSEGYSCMRSAGSKGAVDVIGFKQGELLFVQCKMSAGMIGPDERRELLRLAALVGAVPLVAVRQPLRKGLGFSRLTGPVHGDWVPWFADRVAS